MIIALSYNIWNDPSLIDRMRVIQKPVLYGKELIENLIFTKTTAHTLPNQKISSRYSLTVSESKSFPSPSPAFNFNVLNEY